MPLPTQRSKRLFSNQAVSALHQQDLDQYVKGETGVKLLHR